MIVYVDPLGDAMLPTCAGPIAPQQSLEDGSFRKSLDRLGLKVQGLGLRVQG